VKHARSYLKSIFDEAISQEFLLSDPTRKLKVPNHLRPKDKQVLSWEKMREALQKSSRRDRVLLMLDMTGALRPSELFALRWRSFDNRNTLSITETVYKGQIRPFGKTRKSIGDIYLPAGLATELLRWKEVCSNSSPDAFHFCERGRRRNGYRELPESRSESFGREAGASQAELPGDASHHGDTGAEHGIGEGHSGTPAACEG
jgi:integrase